MLENNIVEFCQTTPAAQAFPKKSTHEVNNVRKYSPVREARHILNLSLREAASLAPPYGFSYVSRLERELRPLSSPAGRLLVRALGKCLAAKLGTTFVPSGDVGNGVAELVRLVSLAQVQEVERRVLAE